MSLVGSRRSVVNGFIASSLRGRKQQQGSRWLLLPVRRAWADRPHQQCCFSITALEATIDQTAEVTTSNSEALESTTLLHPSSFQKKDNDLLIPYPTALSPTAVLEFKQCPQSYLFQYLWRMKQPPNKVLAKGSMCHEALEQVFDLQPSDRTLGNLQNLFRVAWSKHRKTAQYKHLFSSSTTTADSSPDEETSEDWNYEEEREWGLEGLQLLQNYFDLEDPSQVPKMNPAQREVWVRAKLAVDHTLGVTAPMTMERLEKDRSQEKDEDDATADNKTFLVRGIVDRLDLTRSNTNDVVLRLVDYKSGKSPPTRKYSARKTREIVEDAFYQLKVYALLLREANAQKQRTGLDLRMLRLFYLTSDPQDGGKAQTLDYDLGATVQERDEKLREIHEDLSNVWSSILKLVATQDPMKFVGCNRSFCYCHVCRDKFQRGTVWAPPR